MPFSSRHGGHAGTAPSPSWLAGRMADCKAIFLQSLCIHGFHLSQPAAIPSLPVSQKRQMSSERNEKCCFTRTNTAVHNRTTATNSTYAKKCLRFFSVKGRPCIRDSHVQKRGSRLQRQSPHLKIMRRARCRAKHPRVPWSAVIWAFPWQASNMGAKPSASHYFPVFYYN